MWLRSAAGLGALPLFVFVSFALNGCKDEEGPHSEHSEHTGHSDPPADADQDGFTVEEDCDDADASTYPGAAELCDGRDNDCNGDVDDIPAQADLCDGLDNDCDGAVDEDEVALFEAPDGGLVDHSAEVLGATEDEPLLLELADPGELRVCGGEPRYLRLLLSASVEVRAIDETVETVLSAGTAGGSVVTAEGDASVSVSLENLTLRDGVGSCEIPKVSGILAGGGVCCRGGMALHLTKVSLVENRGGAEPSQGRGGGLFSYGCSVAVEDSQITGNQASKGGGGIYAYGSEVVLTRTVLDGNESPGGGGSGLGMESYYDGVSEIASTVEMLDTLVTNGLSSEAIYIGRYASLVCRASAAGEYGITRNDTSVGSAAVVMMYESLGFTGESCDLGSAADGDNNSGDDVYGDDDTPWTADIGNDASFFCSIEQDGCVIE